MLCLFATFKGDKKLGAFRYDQETRRHGTRFPGRVQNGLAEHAGRVPGQVRDGVRPGKGGTVPDQHGGRGVRQPRRGVAGPHPVPGGDRLLPAGNARGRRRETGGR